MVYSFFSLQFFFFTLLAGIAFFVSFYIPGSNLIARYKLKSALAHVLLAFISGIVLWGAQGYLFGHLHLRMFTYIYLAISIFLFWKRRNGEKEIFQNLKKEILHANRLALFIILIGAVVQSSAMFGSGLRYGSDTKFFFTNTVDGMLHLNYIQSIVKEFPPREPGAYELFITNYHIWSDLVLAELVRVWHLPVAHLFFQFAPILISVLTGAAAYLLVRFLGGSRRSGLWSLFLLYFSGDAAYLFMLILHKQFGFYTPAIDNGATQFLNVPHAFAKMVFFGALLPFSFWIKTKEKKWLLLTMLLFSTVVGFKVYFGIFAALGMSFVTSTHLLITFFQQKKKTILERVINTVKTQGYALLFLALFATIAAIIYFPTNQSSGGLIYSPLEWPKLFLGKDALDFREWWLRRQVYDAYHNTRNLILIDLLAIFICLVSVYGTRLIGFMPSLKIYKKLGWEITVFFIPNLFLFTFLGLYTLQVSGLFNVFNFFAVSAVGLSIFGAFILDDLQKRKNLLAKLAIFIFILLTIPRPLHDFGNFLYEYSINHYGRSFSAQEIEALQYIRYNTPEHSIVQSHVNNTDDRYTPYVAFFSNRLTYLSGEGLLETHNQPTEQRKLALKEIFSTLSSEEFAKGLRAKGIEYIYLRKAPEKSEQLKFDIKEYNFEKIFENESVVVYKVLK